MEFFLFHLLFCANALSTLTYTSNSPEVPQAKYSCAETDVWASSLSLFSLPYSKTTASLAVSPLSLSSAIWCGPELCLSRVFQWFLGDISIYNELLVNSVHPHKSHYVTVFRNLFTKKCKSSWGYSKHFSVTHQMKIRSGSFRSILQSVSSCCRSA